MVVVVIVIIAILAVAALVAITSGVVKVTAVNYDINYTGASSDYFGTATTTAAGFTADSGQDITYAITLTNGDTLTHTVNSISLETSGFTLVSVNPSYPFTVSQGGNVSIALTIQVPSGNYDGPLGIMISTN
jgi:hypothetical protein